MNLQSNTQFEWKDTLWLALYQRQNGHATTEVSWSEEPPCNHTGTATLVTEGETTCRGLISVDGCRAGLAKAVQQQLEKFQAQLHNAG